MTKASKPQQVRSKRYSTDSFLDKPTTSAARSLLGATLVRFLDGERLSGRIVEVEAYTENDPASHSYGGKVTARNATMFGRAGLAYVYFTYGNHFCLNVVVGREGIGAAVLLRALEPLEGVETMMRLRRTEDVRNLLSGPGKITQAMKITREQDGVDLLDSDVLRLEPGGKPRRIVASSRIGIRHGREKKWRFCDAESKFLSRK